MPATGEFRSGPIPPATPKRLTPGGELVVSNNSMVTTYGAMALFRRRARRPYMASRREPVMAGPMAPGNSINPDSMCASARRGPAPGCHPHSLRCPFPYEPYSETDFQL